MGHKVPEYNTEDKMHDDYFKDKHKNKFCKGQKAPSNKYRVNYGPIKGFKEDKYGF